jgi:hypothetical protein
LEDTPMLQKCPGRWAAGFLGFLFLAPGFALAEPECSDVHQRRRDCPRSEYCPLHYWAPSLYQVRAYLHPSNLDQYPPGPSAPIENNLELNRYKCRAIPPAPSSPYADPASYYGRSTTTP